MLVREMKRKTLKPKCYIIFLRHGDHLINSGFYPNHMTMGLSEKGKNQARNVANQLIEFPIDLIISSPLLRARETAMIIADTIAIPYILDISLSERVFPNLSGKSYGSIAKLIGKEKTIDLRSGNSDKISLDPSDNLNGYQKRICKFMSDIVEPNEKIILIVSHGGPHDWYLNALYCNENKLSYRRLFNLGKCRASLFYFIEKGSLPDSVMAVNASIPDILTLIKES